jgi:hypothetical protein
MEILFDGEVQIRMTPISLWASRWHKLFKECLFFYPGATDAIPTEQVNVQFVQHVRPDGQTVQVNHDAGTLYLQFPSDQHAERSPPHQPTRHPADGVTP